VTFYRAFPSTAITARELALFGLRGSWGDVLVIVLMGILSGLLGLAMPIMTKSLFDTIIPGAQRHRLLELGVFIASASLASVMFQLTRGFATLRLEGKMEAAVQAAVWDRLLKLPVPFFRRYSAGDLAMRGLSVTAMRQILTGSALSSFFAGIFSVFSFALLFYYSRKMALVATGLTFVALLFTALMGYLQVGCQRQITELRGRIAGLVLQFIMGIAKFRVSGTESRAFMAWAAPFSRQKLLGLKSRRISNWQTVFNSVFPLLSSLAIFWIMAYLMSQPDATPLSTGEFLAFNSAYGQFAGSMLQLTSVFIGVLGIVPLYERAKPILESVPEVDPSKTSNPARFSSTARISPVWTCRAFGNKWES
jgi:ATP-binding cassette subfamily C protein